MRTILLLLALVAAGLLAWWFAGAGIAAGPEAAAHPAPTTAPATAEARRDVAAAPAVQLPAQRSAAHPSMHHIDGRAMPADATPFVVRVVDRATREPVAGAVVHWIEDWQAQIQRYPAAQRRRLESEPATLALDSGWSSPTDEHGRAQAFLSAYSTLVVARHGQRFGEQQVVGEDLGTEVVVDIEPDVTLQVRVRDQRGDPAAGVGVYLASVNKQAEVLRRGWSGALLETDTDGMVTFRHAQQWGRWRYGSQAGQPVHRWQLGIGNAGVDADVAEVDPRAPPDAPIELTLPACGNLRVRPLVAGQPVTLPEGWWGMGAATLCTAGRTLAANQLRWRMPDDDGWIEFRDLGLGETVAFGNGNWFLPVAGPTRPGETVEREVELCDQLFVLQAKVLRADGTPLADDKVGVSLDFGGLRGMSHYRTDADGALLVVREVDENRLDRPLEQVALHWHPTGHHRQHATRAGDGTVRGLVDLGTVALQQAPLLVAGHIERDTGSSRSILLAIERFDPDVGHEGLAAWPMASEIEVRLRGNGDFAAYGELPPGRLRLRVMSDAYLPCPPVEFARGAKDVRVQMRTGGTITVACQVPASLVSHDLQLVLQPDDPDQLPRDARIRARNQQLYTSTLHALEPGTYALEARLVGMHGAAVQRIEGIEVSADPTPLQLELDLRAALREITLDIDIGAGAGADRIPDNLSYFTSPCPTADEQRIWEGRDIPPGRHVVTVPVQTRQLIVGAPGFQPQTVAIRDGVAATTLEPWPTASIVVTGLQNLPASARPRVRTKVVPQGPADERQYSAQWDERPVRDLLEGNPVQRLLEDGRAKVPIGKHPVHIELDVLTADGRDRIQVRGHSPTILDRAGSIVITVPPSEAARLLPLVRGDDKD